MVGKELLKNINFNDSCVNNLTYTSEMILLNIDLCMWKQKEYKEGDAELKEITLKFLNPINYNWNSEKREADIDYDSIIDITFLQDSVKIVMEDNVVSVLTFGCDEIQIC